VVSVPAVPAVAGLVLVVLFGAGESREPAPGSMRRFALPSGVSAEAGPSVGSSTLRV
jgi:hypothetical protein